MLEHVEKRTAWERFSRHVKALIAMRCRGIHWTTERFGDG